MRAIAYTYVYNEADIIRESVEHMLGQGLDVYVLDNWSTDDTPAILAELSERYWGRVHAERFPNDRPQWFDLDAIDKRIEEKHAWINPDWGLLFGADELFESPIPGETVAQALERIGSKGYTAVPTVQATFHPVDNGWKPGVSMKEYFRYWTFGRLSNVRAWQTRYMRFKDGGHDVLFDGRHLWPGERLILAHYPFRNQEQAERKVFVERRPRYAPHNRARGWHTHYDPIQPGHNFIQSADGLRDALSGDFYREVQSCRMS